MTQLFVVLGERDEYSDRDVWISGVFDTREKAEDAVVRRTSVHNIHENWVKQFWSEVKSDPDRKHWYYEKSGTESAVYMKDCGEPENEAAERFCIHEVVLGVWNQI
jgi:hypothetical protein